MDKNNGGDIVTEAKTTNDDVEEGADTETDASDNDGKEKGGKEASEGHQKAKQAHNPYDKKKLNGPSVAVAGKSYTKGEESPSASIEIPLAISHCELRTKKTVRSVCLC